MEAGCRSAGVARFAVIGGIALQPPRGMAEPLRPSTVLIGVTFGWSARRPRISMPSFPNARECIGTSMASHPPRLVRRRTAYTKCTRELMCGAQER
jgi:hypothetical protein